MEPRPSTQAVFPSICETASLCWSQMRSPPIAFEAHEAARVGEHERQRGFGHGGVEGAGSVGDDHVALDHFGIEHGLKADADTLDPSKSPGFEKGGSRQAAENHFGIRNFLQKVTV